MAGDDPDTTQSSVRTYVPTYQKERWREHADRLGMSQSEFVRTMVQAGRRDFSVPERTTSEGDESPTTDGNGLDERVRQTLTEEGACTWDELLTHVTGDVEERLETALEALQEENVVTHSPRGGGYTLREEP